MTYAMTLDNSWEIMNEEEMYDVNGGFSWTGFSVGTLIENFSGIAGLAAGIWFVGKKLSKQFINLGNSIKGIAAFSTVFSKVGSAFTWMGAKLSALTGNVVFGTLMILGAGTALYLLGCNKLF